MGKNNKRSMDSEVKSATEQPERKKLKKSNEDAKSSEGNETERGVKKTKNFVGKSKIDKAKSNKINGKFKDDKGKFWDKNNTNALTEKPADWKVFKKEKKELRLARRKNKNLYDTIVEAKKIGENLRRKNLKGGDEERNSLTKQLHEMLGNKGHYVKLVLAHDMARIVQYLLKFGSPQIRADIAKELIPSTIELVQSKYAKFCVERMLKYGNGETRAGVINAFYGSAVKLSSHTVSAHVLANAYATWASTKQKQELQQEFYGDIYKQNKDQNVHCIADVYKNSPDMRAAVLSSVKANLTRVFNKELLDNQLIHAVLADYLHEINRDTTERNEIISLMSSHAVVLANSKDGSRVVMNCIWHGANKDKKSIMKSLKEHVKDLCCHEHAHTVIITVLDAVDDTVLVSKILLGEIVTNASILAENEWGRKVLLWLVAPADPHHFHPTFIAELKAGYDSGTSKKTPEVRRQELHSHSVSSLLQQIESDPGKWLASSSVAMVTLAIIKAGLNSDVLAATIQKICEHICDPNWMIQEKVDNKDEVQEIAGIEHAGLHMFLKKLAQNDKLLSEKPYSFGSILLRTITNKTIKKWLTTNRGCFLLVCVYESNSEEIKQEIINLLKTKHIQLLQEQTTSGGKILLKKIKEL